MTRKCDLVKRLMTFGLLLLFISIPLVKGTNGSSYPGDKKQKIGYLKEGDRQYFFVSDGEKQGYFVLEPRKARTEQQVLELPHTLGGTITIPEVSPNPVIEGELPEELKASINEKIVSNWNKTNSRDFRTWKPVFDGYDFEDLRLAQYSRKRAPSKPEPFLSAYLLPAMKIVLPLLVILFGLFFMYRKMTVSNKDEFEDIRKWMVLPKDLHQVPGYIEILAGNIEAEWEKDEISGDEIENTASTLNELKKKIDDFLGLENKLFETSCDEIKLTADDIEDYTGNTFCNGRTVAKEDYPLYEERKEIFYLAGKKSREYAVELINRCLLVQKIDFIEKRSFNPGGIADAVLLIKRSVAYANNSMDRVFKSCESYSPDAVKELQDFGTQRKEIVEEFYKECHVIATKDEGFSEKISRLDDAFIRLKTGFEGILKDLPLSGRSKDIQAIVFPVFTKLQQSMDYLRENQSEFNTIFKRFDEIADEFSDSQTRLELELEKTRQTAGKMSDNFAKQNEAGIEFLDNFNANVTQLKQNLGSLETFCQRFENTADHLTGQNEELKQSLNSSGTQQEEMSTKIESFQVQLQRLEDTIGKIMQTATDLYTSKQTFGDHMSRFNRLNSGLESFSTSLQSSTAVLKSNLETLFEQNQSFKENVEGLEQHRNQWPPVYRDIRSGVDALQDEISRLKLETGRLTNGNDQSVTIVNGLANVKRDLTEETEKINQLIDFIRDKTDDANAFLEELKSKTGEIGSDVVKIRAVHGDIEKQTAAGKVIKKQVNDTIVKLKGQAREAEKLFSQLSEQSAVHDISSKTIMETSQGLTGHIEDMQGVLADIRDLEKQILEVDDRTQILEETSQRFHGYEEELLGQVAADTTEIKLARSIFNSEMKFGLTDENSVEILGKLKDEFIESIEYRNYAINILKDFRLVEKSHVDQWYWKLLKPVKDGLEAHKEAFYRYKGQTMYDGIDTSNGNSRDNTYTKEHLRTVINEQHWGQIWEPLIKTARFFEAYFQPEYLDVLTFIRMSVKKVTNLLEKHLGYKIDPYAPLQQVPAEKVDSGEIQEALSHFLFYQDILPHIKNNRQFIEAQNTFAGNGGNTLIVFIDTIGLVDNGIRIRVPKAVLYSPAAVSASR